MKNHTELVREFHDAFDVETPALPCLPAVTIRELRSDLIIEENRELEHADNSTEALDAIADLLYVVHGAALAYGFTPGQVDAAFREVHRSNMSKAWSYDEMNAGFPDDCVAFRICEGKWSVKRKDGKIIKSPSYSKANLGEIVEDVE